MNFNPTKKGDFYPKFFAEWMMHHNRQQPSSEYIWLVILIPSQVYLCPHQLRAWAHPPPFLNTLWENQVPPNWEAHHYPHLPKHLEAIQIVESNHENLLGYEHVECIMTIPYTNKCLFITWYIILVHRWVGLLLPPVRQNAYPP